MLGKIKNLITGKFAKDTIWLTVAQGVLILSGLLLNVVIDLGYGTETLGVFSQALGLYMISSSIFALGINSSIIHHISGEKINKTLFSSGILLSFICTLFLCLLSFFATLSFPFLFSSTDVQGGVIILIFAIPFFNLNKNLLALLTAKRQQRIFSFFRSLRWILLISFISLFTFALDWKQGIYYTFLIEEFLLLVLLVSRLRHSFSRHVQIREMATHFNFGIKSFISEVFAVISNKLDIVIIGYFLTEWEVGVFSFYIFFAKSLLIFPGILQQNINPLVVKHWKEKTISKLETKLKTMRRINTLFSLLQLVVIMIFYSLYVFFFRAEYLESIILLSITCIAMLPLAQIAWGGSILVMTGMLKINIIRTGASAMFSVISLIILSQYFGLIGASIAFSTNALFSFILLREFIQKKSRHKTIITTLL